MKFKLATIESYTYIEAIIDYKIDSELIDDLISRSDSLGEKLNPHSSGGRLRDQGSITNLLLGGLISESVIQRLLTGKIIKEDIEGKILSSTFSQVAEFEDVGINQIDIQMEVNHKTKDIEVRSSFSYKTSVRRLFGFPLIDGKGAFSLIGWYKTANKPGEIKKDYYFFVIHRCHPNALKDHCKKVMKVIVAAAASKDTLEKLGYYSSLKQSNASFRIINPIKDIPGPVQVINELLETS